MKKKIFILMAIPVIAMGFAFQAPAGEKTEDVPGITIPENVQAVFNKSCMPCHGADGSFKAKSRLNFDKLYELKRGKLVSKLTKIADEVKEGSMPKKKFVKKHPDAALSADQKNLVVDWAEKQADQLVAGN